MKIKFLFLALLCLTGCNNVQPNHEGVLMQNYGRNGEKDFSIVTGSQGPLGLGSVLYHVPMWEQKADPEEIGITAKDGGYFTVDPTYTYQVVRGNGAKIVFNYKHVQLDDPNSMMDNIETQSLNSIVLNVYRETARNFTTDSLLTNMNTFESAVEKQIKIQFEKKYFILNNLTSGLKPPKSMIDAIEKRNNAIQQAEQVKNELQIARMQLEKSKIEAEANRVRASGLDNKVLQEKWIDAIKTTENKVIITNGSTPILINQ